MHHAHSLRTTALLTRGAVATILLLTTAVASAGHPAIHLIKSDTARQYADLKVLAQPTVLKISSRDVLRGHVDVLYVARISVRSNTESFLLMLEGNAAFAREIRVGGLEGGVLQMSGRGGLVQQVESKIGGVKSTALDLTFRFALTPSAAPGVYAWPIRLASSPL